MYTVCKKIKIEKEKEREKNKDRKNKREREQGFDCERLTRTVRKREPTSGTN